jgi:hypothetical protein
VLVHEPERKRTAYAHAYSEAIEQIATGLRQQVAWAHERRIPRALGMSPRQWVNRYVRLSPASIKEDQLELEEERMPTRKVLTLLLAAHSLKLERGWISAAVCRRRLRVSEQMAEWLVDVLEEA